jgi:hypothetical protein
MPKYKMEVFEMLFYANCIRANRYKYNYGRQANKTLKDILVPSRINNEFADSIQLKYIEDIYLMKKYVNEILTK